MKPQHLPLTITHDWLLSELWKLFFERPHLGAKAGSGPFYASTLELGPLVPQQPATIMVRALVILKFLLQLTAPGRNGMLWSRPGFFGAWEPALRFALRAPAPEGVSESELEPALRLALELELEALLELDEEPDCDDEDELAA